MEGLSLPVVELTGRQTLPLWKQDMSCAGCIARPPHVSCVLKRGYLLNLQQKLLGSIKEY